VSDDVDEPFMVGGPSVKEFLDSPVTMQTHTDQLRRTTKHRGTR
jgi:hypothetical protein